MPDDDKRYTRLVKGIHILHVGKWDASTGPFNATEKRIQSAFESMKANKDKGVPVAIKYTHAQDAESIGVGTIVEVYLNDLTITADMLIDEDARIPSDDGKSKRTVATIDEIANGLETKKMHISIEGMYNYKNRGYYGDKTMPLVVDAVAVLPPGVVPAVPSEIAAEKQGAKVVLFGTIVEEKNMDLEKALAKIEALEETNKKLQEKIDNLTKSKAEADKDKTDAETKLQEKEKADTEAQAAAQKDEVKAKTEIVEKRILAGDREKFRERIEAHDSPAVQLAVLKDFEDTLPEITAEMEVLLSGGEGDKNEKPDVVEIEIVRLMKDESVSRTQATVMAMDKFSEEIVAGKA